MVATEVDMNLITCADPSAHDTERRGAAQIGGSASVSLRGGVEHLLSLPSLARTFGGLPWELEVPFSVFVAFCDSLGWL